MKNVILFLSLAILVYSCGKPKTVTYPVQSDLKAALNCKPGTYWIYKDSISGRVDSLFITENDHGYFGETALNTPVKIENIELQLTELNISNIGANDTQYWRYTLQNHMFAMQYFKFVGSLVKQMTYAPLINYPFSYQITMEGNELQDAYDGYREILNIDDSINVASGSFPHTAKIHSWGPGENIVYDEYYYLNLQGGFVKRILLRDSVLAVWELQRFKLVK